MSNGYRSENNQEKTKNNVTLNTLLIRAAVRWWQALYSSKGLILILTYLDDKVLMLVAQGFKGLANFWVGLAQISCDKFV